MTDMEMDLIMAKAEILTLQKIVREQSDMIANQRSHIAALQREIENMRKQNEASVKRGRWNGYVCSVCGGSSEYGSENYCPNCGAKMDGDSDG